MKKLYKAVEALFVLVGFTFSLFPSQTEEIVVDEPRGRSHYVPFTLIREKGTYGTVTVNYEVRGQHTVHETINQHFYDILSTWWVINQLDFSKVGSWICKGVNITLIPCVQIIGGPNPALEDLSPDRGNITIPVGLSVVQFIVLIQDDKVSQNNPKHVVTYLWIIFLFWRRKFMKDFKKYVVAF